MKLSSSVTATVSATAVTPGVILSANLRDGEIRGLASAFLLVWLGCLVLVSNDGLGIYRCTSLYLILFGFFHGGLLISVALRGRDGLVVPEGVWVYGPGVATAVRWSILAMIGFTVGAVATAGRAGNFTNQGSSAATDETALRRMGMVGLAVQLSGTFLVIYTLVRAGGTTTLGAGYGIFLEAAQTSGTLPYGLLFLGLGSALGVVAGGIYRRLAWLCFLLAALVLLPLGLRGAVLFPLAILLVVEARRGRRLNGLQTAVLFLAGLSLIGTIREARTHGVGALFSADWLRSPLDAIGEMGFSLRPSVVVEQWHANGERFAHGVTLIATPLRLIEKLTGWHAGPPSTDFRLFNVEIFTRAGPIGGSPVAEGYHNWGLLGVTGLMLLIGATIGTLERKANSATGVAFMAVCALPLYFEIRNSFAPVPVQVTIGAFLVLSSQRVWVRTSKPWAEEPAETPATSAPAASGGRA